MEFSVVFSQTRNEHIRPAEGSGDPVPSAATKPRLEGLIFTTSMISVSVLF